MMITKLLFTVTNVFMLSKINCQIPPRRLFQGVSQPSAPYQESFRHQEFFQSNIPSRQLHDKRPLQNAPNLESYQEVPELFSDRPTNLVSKYLSMLGENSLAFEESLALKRMPLPQQQIPFKSTIGSYSGANSPLLNKPALSNFQASDTLQPSAGPFPRSIFSSGLVSPQNSKTFEQLPITPSFPHVPRQAFESIPSLGLQNPQLAPKCPEIPKILSSSPSSTTPNPNPVSLRSSRPLIPSPLSFTDSVPLPDFYDDPFKSYDGPEPILTSTVGCLELTVTPYGTISEVPLPDPSIPLPRGPFLPVSSPVSALAPPLSPLLPPATPAGKGSNFLRKVPVPPPFI